MHWLSNALNPGIRKLRALPEQPMTMVLQREPRGSVLTRTAVETLGTSHLHETGVWHRRGTEHQFSFARRRRIKLERTVFFLLVTGWTERTLLSWLLPQPPTWPHIGNWSSFFSGVAWQSWSIPVSSVTLQINRISSCEDFDEGSELVSCSGWSRPSWWHGSLYDSIAVVISSNHH